MFNAINFQRLGNLSCEQAVKAFEISSDSKYIVTGGFVGAVMLWDITDGKKLGEVTFDMKIKCVELSYGDEYILFSGETFSDHTISAVHIFRFDTFKEKIQGDTSNFDEKCSLYSKEFHEFSFSRMKFGLFNDRIYFGTEGGSVKVIN